MLKKNMQELARRQSHLGKPSSTRIMPEFWSRKAF